MGIRRNMKWYRMKRKALDALIWICIFLIVTIAAGMIAGSLAL